MEGRCCICFWSVAKRLVRSNDVEQARQPVWSDFVVGIRCVWLATDCVTDLTDGLLVGRSLLRLKSLLRTKAIAPDNVWWNV